MAIKVIAQRRELKIGKNPGVKKFVMRPDLYIPISEKKVFKEAAAHTGVSEAVLKAGVRAKAVEDLEDVKTGLISTRRIVFTPSSEMKDVLKDTSIQITCLDEDGNVLKRVTSSDSGTVEEDSDANPNLNPNPNEGGGGDSGSIIDGTDEG